MSGTGGIRLHLYQKYNQTVVTVVTGLIGMLAFVLIKGTMSLRIMSYVLYIILRLWDDISDLSLIQRPWEDRTPEAVRAHTQLPIHL